MNAETGIRMTFVAVALTFCLLTLEQSASAESRDRDCKQAKGKLIDVNSGNAVLGTITNAGILNGTTETIFNSPGFPTPDPTVVSFTGNFTIRTLHGQLKASNVYLYDLATGHVTVMSRIHPDTSTGRFAGATGVLFFSGKTISTNPFTVQTEIGGEVCLANA